MRARMTSTLAALAIGIGLLLTGPATTLAASSVVECGQLTAYTAPDPLGPTDGSLQLGTVSWVVLANATVSAAAAATLPTLVNNAPTCLALDLDVDGKVTAIDFAAEGSLTGMVSFDSGTGFYTFADRLIIPDSVTSAIPALAALFVTSYQAGTPLTVVFTIDPTTGQFVGFDGTAAFCGAGSVTSGGDGKVGAAIIPASVLDAGDLAKLDGAGSRQACATVHAFGTIDPSTGNIVPTTNVTITVAPAGVTVTPPPTSTVASAATPSSSGTTLPGLIGLGLIAVAAMSTILRRRGTQSRTD
jgi:hypothetical protein